MAAAWNICDNVALLVAGVDGTLRTVDKGLTSDAGAEVSRLMRGSRNGRGHD